VSAPGLLPAASEEEGSDDAESASAAGTADDVLAGCWSDAYEEVDGKSDAAELEDDSEPAESAADMPSSPLGFHMKAPTYACALFKSRTCGVSSYWDTLQPRCKLHSQVDKRAVQNVMQETKGQVCCSQSDNGMQQACLDDSKSRGRRVKHRM